MATGAAGQRLKAAIHRPARTCNRRAQRLCRRQDGCGQDGTGQVGLRTRRHRTSRPPPNRRRRTSHRPEARLARYAARLPAGRRNRRRRRGRCRVRDALPPPNNAASAPSQPPSASRSPGQSPPRASRPALTGPPCASTCPRATSSVPVTGATCQARQLFEPRFDALEPAGIAYCHSPADVATCLSFVRKFRLPVRVRSGGHSYAGWSTVTGGLVIDVSAMNSVSFGDSTVTVGAGLDLIHFYAALAAGGVAVPGGSGPTVGIAGSALGGGIGALSRLYGTTSDNLTAIELLMADGSALTCDGTHNSDVLWACRGGGGGNFGVATSLTFQTDPLTELCVFSLTWPWSQATAVVSAWQSWAPHAPDALWSTLRLAAGFGGEPTLSVSGTYAGSHLGLSRHLDRLYRRVGIWARHRCRQPGVLPRRDAGAGRLLDRSATGLSHRTGWPVAAGAVLRQIRLLHRAPLRPRPPQAAVWRRTSAASGGGRRGRERDLRRARRRGQPGASQPPRSCTGTRSSWRSIQPPGRHGARVTSWRDEHRWLRSYYRSLHRHATARLTRTMSIPSSRTGRTPSLAPTTHG